MKRIFLILSLVLSWALFAEDDIVKASVELNENELHAGARTRVVVVLEIKEGWHINAANVLDDYSIPTKISLINDRFLLTDIEYPEGKITPISWGGNMSLYEATVRIPAVITASETISEGKNELEFQVSYQACNDITCMSPENVSIPAEIMIKTPEVNVTPADKKGEELSGTVETLAPAVSNDQNLSINEERNVNNAGLAESPDVKQMEKESPFQNKSMIVVLMLVFVMGLALNLTPCVYPLIPITMGYFLAQKDTRSPVLLAIMYVLGLAITYSIIGTLAAFGGSMMGSLLAHPATLIFFAVLMLALSLSMFGLYEFKLPNALTQVGGGSRSGAVGALIMGLTMGIVAAPCVGPFVVSLLGFVAQKGSIFVGFITFFVLAVGLGLPYLFLGIFSNKINDLPRSGEWLNGIRIFFGLALIGMSIYFILPLISGSVTRYILPVYMIAAAVYYGVIDKAGLSVAWFSRLKVILSMAVLAVGILMIKPSSTTVEELSWDTYSAPALEVSITEDQPVIIDFYADWCNPCKELEHITFVDPGVVELLKEFDRYKVDLTVVNDKTNALKDEFEIPGVPTIIFYDASGKERSDLRLNGFEKPKDFRKRLEAILAESP